LPGRQPDAEQGIGRLGALAGRPQRGGGDGAAGRRDRPVRPWRLRADRGRARRVQLDGIPAGGPVLDVPEHRDGDLRATDGGPGVLRDPPAAYDRLTPNATLGRLSLSGARRIYNDVSSG